MAEQVPSQEPVYCSWYGVECCTTQRAAAGAYAAPQAVSALRLSNNRLNGDIAAEDFINSLQQLNECGLQHLDLEANDLWGLLTDELMYAVPHLQYLSLGKQHMFLYKHALPACRVQYLP